MKEPTFNFQQPASCIVAFGANLTLTIATLDVTEPAILSDRIMGPKTQTGLSSPQEGFKGNRDLLMELP